MKFDSHTVREWRDLAVEAGRGWQADGVPSMGAALAFYTLFSMAPLLLLAIAIAGFVIGTDTARELVFTQLTTLLGEKGAAAVGAVLKASDNRAHDLFAGLTSLATLALGA